MSMYSGGWKETHIYKQVRSLSLARRDRNCLNFYPLGSRLINLILIFLALWTQMTPGKLLSYSRNWSASSVAKTTLNLKKASARTQSATNLCQGVQSAACPVLASTFGAKAAHMEDTKTISFSGSKKAVTMCVRWLAVGIFACRNQQCLHL